MYKWNVSFGFFEATFVYTSYFVKKSDLVELDAYSPLDGHYLSLDVDNIHPVFEEFFEQF